MARRFARPPRWQRRARLRALLRQINQRFRHLRKRGLVHGLGAGIKVAGGRNTGHLGAVVYVVKKKNVPRRQRIPRRTRIRVAAFGRTERVLTDVIAAPETGEACAVRSGDYLRANDAATCSLSWQADNAYLITCAHCCFTPSTPSDPNDHIGVEVFDPGLHRHVRVGWVDKWSGINTVGVNLKDDARAALLPGKTVDHLRAGPRRELAISVRNFDVAWPGTFVYFAPSGEHSCERPVARAPGDNLTVDLNTPEGTVSALYGSFFMLSMAAGDTVEPGDSGAAIYRRVAGGLEWVGILFGRLGPQVALAFSAPSIAARHNVPLS